MGLCLHWPFLIECSLQNILVIVRDTHVLQGLVLLWPHATASNPWGSQQWGVNSDMNDLSSGPPGKQRKLA